LHDSAESVRIAVESLDQLLKKKSSGSENAGELNPTRWSVGSKTIDLMEPPAGVEPATC